MGGIECSEIKLAMRGLIECIVVVGVCHMNLILSSEIIKDIPKPTK